MNKYYKKLELDKILELLAEQTYSDACREKALKLKPSFDEEEIRTELKKTDDAFKLSAKFGTPRFRKIKDLSMSLRRCKSGSALSFRELLDVADILRETNMLCDWFSQCESMESSLAEYFRELYPIKQLEQRISESIISEEEMSDAASAELSSIRKRIVRQGMNIREQLDKLIKSRSTQKFLQEAIVTMRDGRYVVPVRSEYKNEVAGLVHDTSATGQTFFIEPMSVVEANNEIRVLKSREQAEIERITLELSGQVGENADSIANNFRIAQILELYFAKANLGAKMRGAAAKIVSEPRVVLNQARHPLINPDTVVPISVEIGGKYESLIITGPNTGGKTVALKTCGLLTLMAMSGMLIPAAEGSQISVFDHVLADIGDTQSIEQNLSTFSAHMRSVIDILEQANDRSLVLLDELGSGTDPIEGAALAEAVIQRLKDNGAKLMVTTHYQELKLYATEQPDVLNASCEFDIETLRPTYRLILGSPGKSNAFAICKGLGLSEDIISQAETLVSQENLRFEEAVSKLEETRKALEHDRSAMQQALHQAEEDAAKLREEVQRTRTDRENVMEQARLEAMRIVETTKAQSNEMITELDQLRRAKEKASFGDDVIRAKGNVKRGFRKMYETANPLTEVPDEEYVLPRELQVGDTVMMADTKQKAVVAGKPDKNGTVFLQIGAMRTKVPQEKLRLVAGVEEKKKSQQKQRQTAGRVSAQAARRGTMELDIRGCTCDEGVYQMDAFLDRAVMSHIATVTIIHGKGTGLLRKAIHQRLKQLKYVKNFRLGTFGEGEDGVTIVSLE